MYYLAINGKTYQVCCRREQQRLLRKILLPVLSWDKHGCPICSIRDVRLVSRTEKRHFLRWPAWMREEWTIYCERHYLKREK